MAAPLRVLITVQFAPEFVEKIKAVSPRLVVTSIEGKAPSDIPVEAWLEADILYTHKVLPEPDQAPDLKWIQFHRAGNEMFMEAPILRKPGLKVASMSGASAPQVAEYVLEMILALGHRLPQAMERKARRDWPGDRGEIFQPQELNRCTVGIVGYGSIGRQVAKLLNVFGAQVLATKQNAMQPRDDGYTLEGIGDPEGDYLQRLYPAEALNSMLRECDYVVVCVPLTKDTRGLIGNVQLESMKSSAFLVDVSRGGVVNHDDLIPALDEGKIAGAALDVYPEEPLPGDNPLWKLPNVILTPHIAGFSREYNSRAVDLFVENLQRYLDGKQLLNLIDLQRGY
jgi:phosphoglycerate dehydrogenase-like enzyme